MYLAREVSLRHKETLPPSFASPKILLITASQRKRSKIVSPPTPAFFVLLSPVHTEAFSYETAHSLIRFHLSVTLKMPENANGNDS